MHEDAAGPTRRTGTGGRRVSAAVVHRIRALVRDGTLAPGDRLPPVRELSALFGVGRATVREALRVLEADGLIESRVGAGARIRTPGRDRLEAGLTDLLSLSSVAAREVTAARTLLEVGIVPLLCDHADEQDLAALTDICDRQQHTLDDQGRYDRALSTAFHARLAEATHNPAFTLLIDAFRSSLMANFADARWSSASTGRSVLTEHRAVLDAIRARDPALGTGAMRDHLRAVSLRLLLRRG